MRVKGFFVAESILTICFSSYLQALKVHIDCKTVCDIDYFKDQIRFVSFVRDINDADVNILITSLPTSSGSKQYSMEFRGLKEMEGIDDIVIFKTNIDDVDETIRKKMTSYIKFSLMRYFVKNENIDGFVLSYNSQVDVSSQVFTLDPWKRWIFKLGNDFSFSGEKSYSNLSIYSFIKISKILEKDKISFYINNSYGKQRYSISFGDVVNISRSYSFSSSYIKGFDEHWSGKVMALLIRSDYYNEKFSYNQGVAFEYSIFPYSLATTKSLKLEYDLIYERNNYFERTLYLKKSEDFWRHSFGLTGDIKREWGLISSSINFEKILDYSDTQKLSLYTNLSIRISKGVMLNFSIMYSLLGSENQRYIPAGNVSDEDIFIRRTAMRTRYNYYTSFGITYTFGSIYENVVNTRFD